MAERTFYDTVMNLVLADAASCRSRAGGNGEWSDGGAKELEDQVRFFRSGQASELPYEWKKYVDQAHKLSDPEYSEYQRLKAKFENG